MSNPSRSYAGKTADQRAAERRDRLVEATIAVLAERGEHGTTMTAICAAAKLTERYFYESFAHRDEALVAALDRVSDELVALAVTSVEQATGDPQTRVETVTAALVDHLVGHPDRAAVIGVHSQATPALRERRRALVGALSAVVIHEAADLFGPDARTGTAAHWGAIAYVAGLSELVAAWHAGDPVLTPRTLREAAADLLTATMRRP